MSTILSVETSCDETSAAVLQNEKVLSSIVSSQEIHSRFGGVVPELASRAHIRLIVPIAQKALQQAAVPARRLTGLAVTYGPGLVGALLVGVNFIKGMSVALKIPFIGVNHIEGHIYGNILSQPAVEFPIIFLIVSGGHTQIVLMRDHLQYEILGKTRDDAVGEAFDKGAKLLGLGYPGGPEVDRLAQQGDPEFVAFPRAYLKKSASAYDFSYSGLKTALLTYLNRTTSQIKKEHLCDICASYQKAAVEVLVKKTLAAAQKYGVRRIAVAGGVAANSLLRNWLAKSCAQQHLTLYLPDLQYCTDNAAMIGRVGIEYFKRGLHSDLSLNAYPSLKLTSYEKGTY